MNPDKTMHLDEQRNLDEQMPLHKHLTKGACKYYISVLGVGGGSEGKAYFAFVVRGGGLEAKCLYCLCKG